MTPFGDREVAAYTGQPVECYRVQTASDLYLWTSADRTVTLPQGTFAPEVVTRSGFGFSQEDQAEALTITVARDNDLVAPFIGLMPSTPILVTIYRAHRGAEADAIVWFTGTVQRIKWRESEAVLECQSLVARLARSVPPLHVQTPCNHVLFEAGCKANPLTSRDLVTVTTVSGLTVVSNDFALRADQWFRGGRLVTLDGAETRFIGDHVGDTVTLLGPVPGLVSSDQVYAYWGCDRSEATCASKFNVLDSHLGWARIPSRNPYEGRID